MKSQLNPISQPYEESIGLALEQYPQQDGYLLKLFRVFANSARFITGKGVINLLDKQSPLSLRERELVILRVCANKNCEYEWGVHISYFASKAELSHDQIENTQDTCLDENCWNEKEYLLLTAIDQLCEHGDILASTLNDFIKFWSKEQQLEILALCGNYHTVSFVANVSKIEPESFAARFSAQSDKAKMT
jgi:alkylhydroperoxidase family enzyme